MGTPCERHTPETQLGVGACRIINEVRKRNGKPLHWCTTHQQEAGMPDGTPLERCPGSWFQEVPEERQTDVDAEAGVFAVWGALDPPIVIGNCPLEAGGVHVHHRDRAGGDKDIDDSYEIVRVHRGAALVTVEAMAARALTMSLMLGLPVVAMRCPKPSCQAWHVDENKFATHPHAKHQCGRCGRHFWDRNPSVSNMLVNAYDTLGLTPPPSPVLVDRPRDLESAEYSGIAMWPSTPAIITNRVGAEEAGIHIHAWDSGGNLAIDETYWPVVLDGEPIDLHQLRVLTVQRALAHGAPVVALACANCGTSLTTPESGWVEPRTSHNCIDCGHMTRTRRRSFANPLADK